jgi:hypothetical protein
MAVSVTLHTKSVGAQPVQQAFPHGLGQTPKGAILIMGRGLAADYQSNGFMGIGITDGTTHYSVAFCSDGAAGTSNTSAGRRADPIHSVGFTETTTAVGEFVSWDSTNITLNWSTNNAEARYIGIIAFGGSAISAKVLTWATGTTTGNLGITGAGFAPTTAVHIHDSRQTETVPGVGTTAAMGLGVAGSGGQWFTFVRANDAAAAAATFSETENDAIVWKCSSAGVTDGRAAHVSFDADGETVNRTTATSASMTVGALFLKGIQTEAFTFAKSTNLSVPVAQNATLSIAPAAVLLASHGKNVENDRVDARLAIGLAGAGVEGTFQYQDINAADPTLAFDYVSTTKGFAISQNDTPTTTAEADVTFSGSNVAFSWTTNDANDTIINGLAFGPEVTSGGKGSGGKGKGGNTPGPGEPPKKPLRTSLSKSWKWDRGWR